MRLIFSFLVIVFGVLIANPQTPALAHDLSAGTDMSAAKKKKYRQYVYVRAAPQTGYVRGPWMDPSFGPDGRPYRNPYPPNVCTEDLGYGRFAPCNTRR
jgi:hypothetical protein